MLYEIWKKVFRALTVLVTTSLGLAESFTFQEGGREKTYEIDAGTLYVKPAKGGNPYLMTTPKARSAQNQVEKAKTLARSSNNTYSLVLYPKGAKKSSSSRRYVTREMLVELTGKISAKRIAIAVGAQRYETPSYAKNFVILSFAESSDTLLLLKKVSALEGVRSAAPLLAKQQKKREQPNDPYYRYSEVFSGYQWHLLNTGENGATPGIDANLYNTWCDYEGSGVTIGVIDDGLQEDHPDLAANVNTALGRNWNDGDADDPNPGIYDHHGTPCAGVIAAVDDNSEGGTGAAPGAKLVGMRLIAGASTDQDEAESVAWQNGQIHIKSNSWGPPDNATLGAPGSLFQDALADSILNGRGGLGTIHVWAAGNGGENDNVNYDAYANSLYTIAVGAVTDYGERSEYSEPGAAKVISAPSDGGGQGITTTAIGSGYIDDFGGTSSAAPLISGIIALMLEANPELGWRDVQEILIQSARQIDSDDAGWSVNGAGFAFHHDYGAGLVDTDLAVSLAKSWVNLGTHLTHTTGVSTLNQAVPDNSTAGTSATFTIPTSANYRLEHVTLTANITHPNRGELKVTLTSPSGTVSVLAKEAYIDATEDPTADDDFTNWTFMSVHHWGEAAAGEWTLTVYDEAAGVAGTLDEAELRIYGSALSTASTPTPIVVSDLSVEAEVNVPFYHRLYAKEKGSSFTVSSLPAGLSYQSAGGVISGVPEATGTYTVSVNATNTAGTSSAVLTITVNPKPEFAPVIQDRSFLLQEGFSHNHQITATGEPTSYAAANLPAGLTLDTSTGIISGEPTTVGTTAAQISAANRVGTSPLANYSYRVVEPISAQYGEALDATDFVYKLGEGDALWTNQSETAQIDGDALQSPETGNNEATSFSTTVTGPGTLSFWAKTSTEEFFDILEVRAGGMWEHRISGERDWRKYSITLDAGPQKITWRFSRDGFGGEGSNQVWIDGLTFGPTTPPVLISLAEGVDFIGIDWPAASGWRGTTTDSYDGLDAVESLKRGNNTKQDLKISLEGPGRLSFYYKVSSEDDYDFFRLYLDSELEFEASGEVDWTLREIEISAGRHEVVWSYEKDGTVSNYEDRAWIDQVRWVQTNLTGYQNWKHQFYSPAHLSDSTVSGDKVDSDGDGIPTLFEYAFRTDPSRPGTETYPVFHKVGDQMKMDYLVDLNRTDLRVYGQQATTLSDWKVVTPQILSTEDNLQKRQVSLPIVSGEKGFMQLVAERIEGTAPATESREGTRAYNLPSKIPSK